MPMISRDKGKEYLPPSPEELKSFLFSRLYRKERKGIFLIAGPPGSVAIRYEGNRYTLGIPWHLFGGTLGFGTGIRIIRIGLWFLKKKPEKTYETVHSCSLPNVSSDGVICYGSAKPYCKYPVEKYVKALYHRFWQTRFNSDIVPWLTPWGKNNYIGTHPTLFRWQEESKEGREPDFVRTGTIHEVLKTCLNWTFPYREVVQEEASLPTTLG